MEIKPFLKWAGGKSKISEKILVHFKKGTRLVEPFIGSGVIFLNSSFDKYLLCDINNDLISLYVNLKNRPEELVYKSKSFFSRSSNTEDNFYFLRNKFNSLKSHELEKSALFIYLNRHGFNGLCRYNRKGLFNVPFGKYKTPFFPEERMFDFANKSQYANFKCQDFNKTFAEIKSGDIVYCDPPYVPLSKTSNFTTYSKSSFTLEDQKNLSYKAMELKEKKIQCVISNHDTIITRNLYKEAKIFKLKVQRNIASRASSRKKIDELVALF